MSSSDDENIRRKKYTAAPAITATAVAPANIMNISSGERSTSNPREYPYWSELLWSYNFRFSASVKIATAFPIALNASAAPGAWFLSKFKQQSENLNQSF